MPVTHALTFDIEEWFHLVGVKAMDDRSRWDDFEPTVERDTDQILQLLSEHKARGTFFVLGWIANRYPQLVRKLAAAGHELATHSYWHYEVYKHSRETFRDDLARSIDVLADCGDRPILGFRAPSFSLVPGCEWALDIMLDLGLKYDASIFPARRSHGGYPHPGQAGAFAAPSGRSIQVLPMSTFKLGPLRLPFSGGGYLRLLPQHLLLRGIEQHEQSGRPAVVYLHPWDFAPDGPRTKMPLSTRIKCYQRRQTTAPKLSALLDRFRFDTCARVLGLHATK